MVGSVKPAVILFFLVLAMLVLIAVFFIAYSSSDESEETLANPVPILVIDPGHGGADGGAVSVTGSCESKINLSIALKMSALAGLTATPHVMTRESEDIDYPPEATTISKMKVFDQKRRVEFIGGISNAVLLSVHQNNYPSTQPRGPQAFYGKNVDSTELASMVQEALNSALYPGNRRVASPISGDIYLFKSISCPAVLAECGFLSNPEEAALLEEQEYQLKVALALMGAYYSYLSGSVQFS